MSPAQLTRLFGAAAVATGALLATPIPSAAAAPCPDVEVVFARGTFEPPGLGGIGQSFVDAVRAKAASKSVSVYPVNYPASTDFPTAVQGIRDAANRIESTAGACPDTKIVLGGFSQGAAVAGFVTSEAVPSGADAAEVPDPMPPEVADHVAAVVLLGKPSPKFMELIGTPPVEIGGLYAAKTIDLCIADDPICSGSGDGANHSLYNKNGMTDQAATFAVGKL
ncbi:cutinase family protein [Mycolicibacterium stellerae]|uniref:cutinase family protein n=1 Tax=Mycolicibacterium stellerae TaxID=2358193 RepID=UPI000F0B0461|nr:cutinase family protein [Mycolicibacterium stellerae]